MITTHTKSSFTITSYAELSEDEKGDFWLFNTDQDIRDPDTLVNLDGVYFTNMDLCYCNIVIEGVTYNRYVPTGILSGYIFDTINQVGSQYRIQD